MPRQQRGRPHLLNIVAAVAGFAFGRAFPALGVLLGAPLLLLGLLWAALRFWPVTLALGVLMLVNWTYNNGGPEYVPPTPAELAAGTRAPLPPGAEAPRYGALLRARLAVEDEVNRTAASEAWGLGAGFLGVSASIRNTSAFASLKVYAVRCEARTKNGSESRRFPVDNVIVPPGAAFRDVFQLRYPYPGNSLTESRCSIDYEVVLP